MKEKKTERLFKDDAIWAEREAARRNKSGKTEQRECTATVIHDAVDTYKKTLMEEGL